MGGVKPEMTYTSECWAPAQGTTQLLEPRVRLAQPSWPHRTRCCVLWSMENKAQCVECEAGRSAHSPTGGLTDQQGPWINGQQKILEAENQSTQSSRANKGMELQYLIPFCPFLY